MIISHQHKFIFFKVPKAAGTSVEIALSLICGDKDILTPISKKDELKRIELGGPTARNYRLPFSSYNFQDWTTLLLKRERKAFYNHISPDELYSQIDAGVRQNYQKLAVVRNPWDQMASQFYWRNKKGQFKSFDEFLDSDWATRLEWRTRLLLQPQGEFSHNHYIRFEQLSEDLSHCYTQIGISEAPYLPHTKGGFRKDKGKYQSIYSDATRKKVGEMYDWLINEFHFDF
jgi:hypothetical protein